VKAVVAEVARWCDETLDLLNVKPDITGDRVFRVLVRNFDKMVGKTPNTYFRKLLSKFGYKIHRYRREYQITKIGNH